MLGEADKVISNKDNTTIIGGKGRKSDIEKRVETLKSQIEKAEDFDREKLEERLAKMIGGVGVIKVGAATESEMEYKKAKLEDALAATQAAVEEGIVPGGGLSLLYGQKAINELNISKEETIGAQIVKRALAQPVKMIAQNAGQEGSVVVSKIDGEKKGIGYDAARDRYTDLIKAGIIDPVKVTRSAIQNATSAAAILLTTEAAVSDIEEEDDSSDSVAGAGATGMPGDIPGGGMGMGM